MGLLVLVDKFLRHSIIKGGISLLFLLMSFQAGSQPISLAPDPNQLQFEQAIRLMQAGSYALALEQFADLYALTSSLRVKLEWARTAFLAKQYDLANDLFLAVLEEPIPDVVRFNVSLYLSEIAQLGNQTDWGIGFTRDFNPFGVPEDQEIILFGLPFQFVASEPREHLFGITGYVRHARPLNSSRTLRFVGEFNGVQYEGSGNNKGDIRLGMDYRLPTFDNVKLKAGIDHYYQKSTVLLRQPYLGAEYRKDQLSGFLNQYQIEGRLARNDYPDFDSLNGHTWSIATFGAKNITPTLQLGVSTYMDDTSSDFDLQSYRTLCAGMHIRFYLPSIRSNLRITYFQSRRRFGAVDPLFQVRRVDDREFFSVSVQPYALKVFGLYPSIELGFEETKSAIPINSSDKTVFNFRLRKNY